MAVHPLVTQLCFARSEFARGIEGVSPEDAVRRVGPMYCLSWMVGHLANQEHHYWVSLAQRSEVVAGLNNLVGSGRPASTPPLAEMWAAWRTVTARADAYLDALTPATVQTFVRRAGRPMHETVGTLLLRNTYHYWFHTGEAAAVRQLLGHTGLPQFVGDMSAVAYAADGE